MIKSEHERIEDLEKRVEKLEEILASNHIYEQHNTRSAYDLNKVGGMIGERKNKIF